MNYLLPIAIGALCLLAATVIAALGASITWCWQEHRRTQAKHHLKHLVAGTLFWLVFIAASTQYAHACGDDPQPNPVPAIACAVC